MTVCNTWTRFAKKGSPTFMAPEIQIKTQLIYSARIDDMRKIDM